MFLRLSHWLINVLSAILDICITVTDRLIIRFVIKHVCGIYDLKLLNFILMTMKVQKAPYLPKTLVCLVKDLNYRSILK